PIAQDVGFDTNDFRDFTDSVVKLHGGRRVGAAGHVDFPTLWQTLRELLCAGRPVASVLRHSTLDLVVQRLLQQLARLEVEDAALGDGDWLTGLGIATLALALVSEHEVSEPGNLDFLAATQRFFH